SGTTATSRSSRCRVTTPPWRRRWAGPERPNSLPLALVGLDLGHELLDRLADQLLHGDLSLSGSDLGAAGQLPVHVDVKPGHGCHRRSPLHSSGELHQTAT